MSALQAIKQAFLEVGYRAEAVVPDYSFADVLAPTPVTRTAPLVAFARTPPSYRSAALGVLHGGGVDSADLVHTHRALGAPFMLVVEGDEVTVWQVRSDGPPRVLDRVSTLELPELFERYRERWHPDAIHRAKALGRPSEPYQTDFIDVGLLPAIEGEIHLKLDRLLVESLDLAREVDGARIDPRRLFRVVFRLLAAKVLQDRGHPFAKEWKPDDLSSVLSTIERYYGLPVVDPKHQARVAAQFAHTWDHLRSGISFSNISSDDLAFVYENTLITEETRNLFGTHSTPRQLAEYIVQRLDLHLHKAEDLRIYEPCAGAGVFLVSALRHLRDLLPDSWSDAKRHSFLIDHVAGDEIDPFACEVATLSLILADYPNHNGWHIREVDLFDDGMLATKMADHNVILCNPPFEAFSADEKRRYPQAANNVSKAIAVLGAAIDARPIALGFVLPRAFILEKQFLALRRRLENIYTSIEIVELPDRIFGVSQVESAALIAKGRTENLNDEVELISTNVSDRDRLDFLVHGRVTATRRALRLRAAEAVGDLWIPPLDGLWQHLANAPVLGNRLQPAWGVRWNYAQNLAATPQPRDGHRSGYLQVRGFRQYLGGHPVHLDFNLQNLREGHRHDWTQPKIIMNAMRLRRGPWRVGAMVDFDGLIYSQQFFGLWPVSEISADELLSLCAVLNGPVANAYLSIYSPRDRFRSSAVARLPIPEIMPSELPGLVRKYLALARQDELFSSNKEELAKRLAEIDALTITAYDLPSHIQFDLAQYFTDASRPVAHEWPPKDASTWIDAAEGVAQSDLAEVNAKIIRANSRLQSRFFKNVRTLRPDDAAVRALGGRLRLQEWQAERRIFAVEADNIYYPAFQFDSSGPRPIIRKLLETLPSTFSAWQTAFWFVSANPWLDGAAPTELLDNPDILLNAAVEAASESVG